MRRVLVNKRYKSFNLIIIILLVSIFSLLFISCGQDPSAIYTYQPPENLDDGLDISSLDEVGIDPELIEKGIYNINRGKYGEVHSILIFKDDKLIFEKYFKGYQYKWDGPDHHGEFVRWNSSTLHALQSVTKSITSACIGIAVDKGFIGSVSQSIFDYLPDHQYLKTDGKDKITIEHLLTMTSGLQWDEWSAPLSSSANDTIGIWFSDKDPITFVLERPLVSKPGTSFTYSGGNIHVLSEIISSSAGMNLAEFSAKYLFEPLGIDSFDWWLQFENGLIDGAGGLKITPRDMVKVGTTFLNNGVWNGQQIISGRWVGKSAASYPANAGIKIPGEDLGRVGYSYTWWTKIYSDSNKKINMYWANGWGGQKIMVLPEVNTVIVFTGGNYTSEVYSFKILEKYILPAFS